ncbi:MAG TPA: YhgE/Pip domain-containing protein, partial [Pseudogracilibacillus sp.]|nr:YhgE/Pip domain-containing protein [Pseudogracilibacillus sp.]
MRNIWNIFKLDIKNITTNWVVAILIGGLIILPSLYAWLNIKASWDPYGQTDQIPIGLVNEDKGATIRDKEVHVGDSLVEVLRKNEDFNWQFVDRKKALEEVEYGNYYAVIIVPEDFSETLGTVITDSPEKAQIEYYVNEKINSIAPKITEKGASVIVEQISSEFIATVNGVIFDMFNQIGLEIEEGLPDIQQFEQYIFTLESELPNIHDLLTSTNKDADNAKQIIKKANKLIPEVKSTADNGLNTVDKALKILEEAENRLKNMAPKINEDLKKIQSTLTNVHERLGQIDTSDINVDKQKESLQQMNNRINQSMESLEEMKNVFLQIQENMAEEKESVTSAIERVETLVELLQFIQDEATKIDQFVNENESKIAKIKEGLKNIDELASTNIDKFIEEYTNTIEPTVFKELKRGKDTITQAKNMLVEVKSTIPKVERLLKNTNNHLDEGKGMLETVLKEFPYIKDKVKEVANQIRKVQSEADVNEIIQLLRNDPEAERGFFAEPVVLNKNELFPIPNYGTGMTPFYTVLSLWDGALLLISLLTTDFPSM